MIKGAIAKVINNKAYKPLRSKVTQKCLVIGGGISGITAALDTANSRISVILFEKSPTIGSKMAMLSTLG